MKRARLFLGTVFVFIFATNLIAGGISTKKFDNYGKMSVSAIPGFYGDVQLNFQNVWHVGGGMGYRPTGRRLYSDGNDDAIFDLYAMYQVLKLDFGKTYTNLGLTGGIFMDGTAAIGPQLGVTTETFFNDKFSMRLNLIYGPRAGIEFVYRYDWEINFTLGISGISGVIGMELEL